MEFVTDRHTHPKIGLMVKIGADKLRTFVLHVSSGTLYLLSFRQLPTPSKKEDIKQQFYLFCMHVELACLSQTRKEINRACLKLKSADVDICT
jgi:hypothetical protein